MLLIPCPICGPRPELEFRYGGQAHVVRPGGKQSAELSDQQFSEFLYFRDNPKGIYSERWRHISGCGRFFNCVRDTVSDKILATYKSGEQGPDLATLQGGAA